MSLVQTIVQLGFTDRMLHAWIPAFGLAAAIAIPTAILVAPYAQRLIRYLTTARVVTAGLIVGAALLTNACTNLESHVVEQNGQEIEIVTAGSGAATVVFESGLGNDWTPWDAIASDISRDARVFAYSRPGYGKSSAATTPRDPATIVEELRALLAHQGYAPPYILVGHSFGGTYMELFAKAHPGEVTGVVLVEPRHRDFLALCEAAHLDMCGISASDLATLPDVQIAEYNAFPMAAAEMASAGTFGSYPVRVLTATGGRGSAARHALWEATHASLAAEAKDGRHTLFAGASHNLEIERASEVAEIVRALLPPSGAAAR
jgi:predicted alpha/beta hydrolase family esterase